MDTRFDENEAEFGVFVFAVALEMLSDSDTKNCQYNAPQATGLLGMSNAFFINM